MCRLLEHSSADPHTICLINEALLEVADLSQHRFGHHVVESILEHGLEEQKHKIVAALTVDMFFYASHSQASYVIESALRTLRNGSIADHRSLVAVFLNNEQKLFMLAEHSAGFHVLKALLKYSEQSSIFKALLQKERSRLHATAYGNRILDLL